jgi:hypothetical protein
MITNNCYLWQERETVVGTTRTLDFIRNKE